MWSNSCWNALAHISSSSSMTSSPFSFKYFTLIFAGRFTFLKTPGMLKHPSSISAISSENSKISGLITFFTTPSCSSTKNLLAISTWFAASPTPLAFLIRATISSKISLILSSTTSTFSDFSRKVGCPYKTIFIFIFSLLIKLIITHFILSYYLINFNTKHQLIFYLNFILNYFYQANCFSQFLILVFLTQRYQTPYLLFHNISYFNIFELISA